MFKTTFLGILFIAMLAPLLMAGEPSEDTAGQAKQRLAELVQRLNLTDEQKQKIAPIVKSEVGELKAIRAKYPAELSRRDKRKMFGDMKSVQRKYEPQIAAILTKEQQAEWKKIKEESKERLKQMAKEKSEKEEKQPDSQ
jgi:hypothetical protein